MGMLVVSPKTGREIELVGTPTGPEEYHPEFGCSVKTFEEPPISAKRRVRTLHYHVPLKMRGTWRPEDDLRSEKPILELTKTGHVRCTSTLGQQRKMGNRDYEFGAKCQLPAVNRTYFCTGHGGCLHPLDRQKKAVDFVPRTRQEKFAAGIIHIEDMTDEELALKRFMDKNGKFTGRRPKFSADVELAMGQELMRRLNDKVAKAAPKALDTMVEVATSDVYEGADRVKAATWLAERHMGKTADRVVHEQAAPWEVVFEGIAGGTRDESRALREATLDVEVVEPEIEGIEGTRPRAYTPPGTDASDWGGDDDSEYNDDGPGDELAGDSSDSDSLAGTDSTAGVPEQEELTPEERALAVKEFKERLRKAKGKRIWNREHGYKTIADRGYVAEESDNDDGTTTMVFYLEEKE